MASVSDRWVMGVGVREVRSTSRRRDVAENERELKDIHRREDIIRVH